MSIKKTLFETKEDYLAFRKAFASATHDKQLTAAHFVLLNLLRDKPIHCGFTIITNKNKLLNGMEPHYGFKLAVENLSWHCKKDVMKDSWTWGQRERFLEPLNGTVTVEMLEQLKLKLPKVSHLNQWYGKGTKIIPALITGKMKPEELWEEVITENVD